MSLCMENETLKDRENKRILRSYELLSKVKRTKVVHVRDDQYEFPWLLDSARISRKKGHRFGVIDTGKLDCLQLEWLAEAGADIYTSNEARPKPEELELLSRTVKKGKAIMVFFHHGALETEERENLASFGLLKKIGRNGVYIHLSNREREHNFSVLHELAFACRDGGSWVVYYHHGGFVPQVLDLARKGIWVHLSDKGLQSEEEQSLFTEAIKTHHGRRLRFVLHVEKGLTKSFLKAALRAGAIVLPKGSITSRRSPLLALENKARKAKLDSKAYYLSTSFLP